MCAPPRDAGVRHHVRCYRSDCSPASALMHQPIPRTSRGRLRRLTLWPGGRQPIFCEALRYSQTSVRLYYAVYCLCIGSLATPGTFVAK